MDEFRVQWEEAIIRCIRCGACRVACPVFEELGNESYGARGRVRLLRALIYGEMPVTPGIIDRMSACLLCKSCTEGCPSGMEVYRLVRAARAEIVRAKGLPLWKSLAYRGLLSRKGLFDLAFGVGRSCRGAFLAPVEGGGALRSRLGLGPLRGRHVAPIGEPSFLATAAARQRPARDPSITVGGSGGAGSPPRPRVAFFAGCLINYGYPGTGHAAVRVLERLGAGVIVPPEQGCCGTPIQSGGDVETARRVAERAMDLLLAQPAEYVAVACASCGFTLVEGYRDLFPANSAAGEKARALASRVRDVSALAVELGGLPEDLHGVGGPAGVPTTVTYHDPCHLNRGQGVSRQPRQLLAGVPGVKISEMANPARCCGFGGTFSIEHYELARQINDHKIQDILSTGADVVVTGCPGCRMHITDGLRRHGSALPVLHTVEVLDRALAGRQGVESA